MLPVLFGLGYFLALVARLHRRTTEGKDEMRSSADLFWPFCCSVLLRDDDAIRFEAAPVFPVVRSGLAGSLLQGGPGFQNAARSIRIAHAVPDSLVKSLQPTQLGRTLTQPVPPINF